MTTASQGRGTCTRDGRGKRPAPHPSQREHSNVSIGASRCYCKPNAHPFLLLIPQLKKEMGVPESNHFLLPCLTSDSQPPRINSSAILPYFRAIRPLSDKNIINKIIEQLDKLKLQHEPETEVSVPADTFESKSFILTILQQFSACLGHVFKSLNPGPQQVMQGHLVEPIPSGTADMYETLRHHD